MENGRVKYDMQAVKDYLTWFKDKDRPYLGTKLAANSTPLIMAVQIALESKGFEVGGIDGILWNWTRWGVRAFQEKWNSEHSDDLLNPDGKPGPETIKRLLQELGVASTEVSTSTPTETSASTPTDKDSEVEQKWKSGVEAEAEAKAKAEAEARAEAEAHAKAEAEARAEAEAKAKANAEAMANSMIVTDDAREQFKAEAEAHAKAEAEARAEAEVHAKAEAEARAEAEAHAKAEAEARVEAGAETGDNQERKEWDTEDRQEWDTEDRQEWDAEDRQEWDTEDTQEWDNQEHSDWNDNEWEDVEELRDLAYWKEKCPYLSEYYPNKELIITSREELRKFWPAMFNRYDDDYFKKYSLAVRYSSLSSTVDKGNEIIQVTRTPWPVFGVDVKYKNLNTVGVIGGMVMSWEVLFVEINKNEEKNVHWEW